MVYSRSASTRAYAKAVALCALTLVALPHAVAQGDEENTVACEVSDGDKSFGVRVVDDAGCANGGLGCYNDHCRYCKIIDTPKSTEFESCSSFGANFLSMTPLTVTTGPCEISEGDAAVGIAAVVDADCLYGGLGCFGDHCRFCKVQETPESTAFLGCSDFNTTTLVTNGTVTVPATAVVVTDPVAVTDASCPLVVAEGDASVGINIVTDASCAAGGAGCIDEVCRFCRVTTTVQSAAFTDCSAIAGATVVAEPTTAETPTDAPTETPTEAPTELPTEAPVSGSTCEQVASEGDAKVGITIVTDTSCSTGGIGCITNVCRFCRVVYTEQSAAFTNCDTISGTVAITIDAPTTDAPTTDTPTVTSTEAPTTETPTEPPIADQPVCTQVVSSGDASVGINIVTDATCKSGGVGCIDDVCRFCKVLDTTQSTSFADCTSVAGYSTTVVSSTATPIDVITDAPRTDAPTTEAPTDAPTDAVTDVPTTETPTETPAATTATLTSGGACTQVVSDGDASVGINIFTDTSCASGGVGCIDDVCRFCKATSTDQSAAFVDCPSA
ncbi:hypothetical protein PRNP1_007954 [Phytophthora ramorum]